MPKPPRVAALLVLGLVAGCSTAPRTFPSSGAYLANASVQLTPNLNISLEKMVFWGALAGAAYLVYDPLTPNWEIEEAQLSPVQYHLSMRMKRFYAGGAGEAQQAFNQRAKDIARSSGAADYAVLEYSEGLESSVLGSRRVSRGVIQLTGLASDDAGKQHPAQDREGVVE